jgi:hypothetical protein
MIQWTGEGWLKMKRNTLNFWVDASLFILLSLSVLTVLPEVMTHSMIHAVPGLLLIGGVGVHLWLHRKWITTTLRRFASLSGRARRTAGLNALLLGVYLACATMGLAARRHLDTFPLHFAFGVRHLFLALLLLVLQATHIIRHWSWITATYRRLLRGDPVPRLA